MLMSLGHFCNILEMFYRSSSHNFDKTIIKQAVVLKHNKPRPYVAHRGIARFLRIDPKLNQVVPWSLCTFPENFMQIGPAVFS